MSKSLTFECDICGDDNSVDDIYYCTTPRPSDQTELVAVMWICKECSHKNPGIGARTRDDLEYYFDSGEAAKTGLIFLSI